jgi:hypothetical protein
MEIKTPKTILCNTGEQEPAYKTMSDFFGAIKDYFKKQSRTNSMHFEIRHDLISKDHYGNGYNPSDDKIHMLVYRENVIATVTETRTDLNHIKFNFFQNLEGLL